MGICKSRIHWTHRIHWIHRTQSGSVYYFTSKNYLISKINPEGKGDRTRHSKNKCWIQCFGSSGSCFYRYPLKICIFIITFSLNFFFFLFLFFSFLFFFFWKYPLEQSRGKLRNGAYSAWNNLPYFPCTLEQALPSSWIVSANLLLFSTKEVTFR